MRFTSPLHRLGLPLLALATAFFQADPLAGQTAQSSASVSASVSASTAGSAFTSALPVTSAIQVTMPVPASTGQQSGGWKNKRNDSSRSTSLFRIKSNGINRWYRVHNPPNFNSGTPTPVVVAFHGGGGNADQFRQSSGLNDAADQHGFVVVYPEGTGVLGGWPFFTVETWNAGECCGYAAENDIDDVKFSKDLLNDLGSRMTIDTDALFATGHSNGAMMCYRLAIEAPGLFAALAPNAGARDMYQSPNKPVPLIIFHGALDCHVPFEGGMGCGISGTYKLSQEDTLRPFVVKNHAIVPPLNQPTEVRGAASRYEAPAPSTGADIHYWWMTDHGHSWPGHGNANGDPTNMDIDINEEMWVFFDQHRR